jgi:sulfane dehydrogenase subunit SoxC
MSISHRRPGPHESPSADAVAGNGLLDRRALLGGIALAGAAGTGITASRIATAEPLTEAPWSLEPGAAITPYEVPSRFEKNHMVVRQISIRINTDW